MEAYYKVHVNNRDVSFLLGLLFLAFSFFKTFYFRSSGFGILSDFVTISVISSASILIRLIAVLIAYKVAKDMNRIVTFWMFFSFLSPPLGLLILSGLKQIFPDDVKNEANFIIKEYQNKISLLKNQLYYRKINSIEYKNRKEQTENDYNQILNNGLTGFSVKEFNLH